MAQPFVVISWTTKWIPPLLLLLLLLALQLQFQIEARLLANVDLSKLSYEDIHRLAVIDQVQNTIPAQKSLGTRRTRSLDGMYEFCFDDLQQGFEQQWYGSSLRHRCRPGNFYKMPVPSAFNDILSNATARNYIGWLWYQTTISPPPARTTSSSSNTNEVSKAWNWFLQFDSVNYLAVVWIQHMGRTKNTTHLVGSHVGGHLPFILNITRALRSGNKEATGFRLTIAVSNRLTQDTIPSGKMLDLSEQVGREYFKFQPDFDFFHFAGIMGSVNLIQLPPVHLAQVSQIHHSLQHSRQAGGVSKTLAFNACLSSNVVVAAAQQQHDSASLAGASRLVFLEAKLEAKLLSAEGKVLAGKRRAMLNESSPCGVVEFSIEKLLASNYRWTPLLAAPDGSGDNTNHFPPLITARFLLEAQWLPPNSSSSSATNSSQSHPSPAASGGVQSDMFELKVGLMNGAEWMEMQHGQDTTEEWGINNVTTRSLTRKRRAPIKLPPLQGFGMHHEQLFSGRTMSRSAIMKDIYLLKQTGANVIRTSHYPYSSEYLDACDENGILVIAEGPAVGLSSFGDVKLMLHKQILLEMMQRDHHHPSIIMWSVANEPQSQMVEAKGYFESLLKYAREELAQYTVKANRPLTAALAQSHLDDKVGHTLDVIMVNRYYGWYDYTAVIEAIRLPLITSLAGWSSKYPGKPLILSEFGADTLPGLHSCTRELFSEEFQRDLLVEHERVIEEIVANKSVNSINLWGSMIWNFADFSTHDSLLRAGGNKKGIFTRDRSPKLSVASVREIYLNRSRSSSSLS